MYVLELEVPQELADRLVAELWERGTRGIIEEAGTEGRLRLRAYFDAPFPAEQLGVPEARWQYEEPKNWARLVMEEWEPILVGQRFFVAPAWRQEPTPTGRLRLVVYPGAALGTGYHPTTQMCLEAMEVHLRPSDVFLDVGTGSGILCQAAWLLGTRRLVGCDTDPEAVQIARENLILRERIPALLYVGSIDAMRWQTATVAAANIGPGALIELAEKFAMVLRTDGVLLASGFESEEAADVRLAFERAGFRLCEERERQNWIFHLYRLSRTGRC